MSRNTCGQRALALALHHARGEPLDVARIVRDHPPDTPWALLGTTPWGFARAARGLGFDARVEWSLRARPLPRAPFAALVNLRAWGRRLPEAHWVLALDARDDAVRCAGLVETPLIPGGEGEVPRAHFEAAWRGYPFPGYAHGAVLLRDAPRPLRGG